MIYKFYDTSSLLLKGEELIKNNEHFTISSVTLSELERIKTSSTKDNEIKYKARKLINLLTDNLNNYTVWIFNKSMLAPIEDKGFDFSADMAILATALDYDKNCHPDEVVFVTNDLLLYNIANLFFGEDSIEIAIENDEIVERYDGYREIIMSDDEMAKFYSDPKKNNHSLNINEYLILKNTNNEVVDTLCWNGEEYRHLSYKNFNSRLFGLVRPVAGDIYQAMAADSLTNNQITMIKGPAGSGKSWLALSYLLSLLEKGKIDKIIVFCNTIATKGSAKLGFYPGSRDEKLLDSQIGNLLVSKFGGKVIVEQMVQEEKLVLMPLSDIRGYDTSGMNAGIYISEAQNMDIDLMKLALQRIGEDSICIIDGDCEAQVDDKEFAGARNGMRRASQVFRNHDVYGEVTLKNIHRSKIAAIAENM